MADISKFKDLYISETEDQLQILNENLLILEKKFNDGETIDYSKNILDVLMRASHTIKGSSATMGFNDMAYLAHVMEDVYDGARNDTIELTSEMVNCAYQAIDKLDESLESIKTTNSELPLKDLADGLKKITGVDTEGIGKSNKKKTSDSPRSEDGAADEPKDKSVSSADKFFSNKGKEDVDDAVKKIDYIKVPIKRLDALMDLVEELVIDRMALQRLGSKSKELQEVADHIGLLIQSLQYEVMQARLVPVDQVFARFPRMIRDLSKKQGKKVEFFINGADLELDRSIVDKLGEPLVHLLRNAVDHGILIEGFIKLEAKRDRENALIIVENNDQSINIEKVKQSALKRGIIGNKEAEAMSERDIMNLIFHPRLSTSEEITEISGRGVGLSVVKTFAESSGGRVIVENINPGVRFVLELPLTLAIINSLLIEINSLIYAIPFSNISRSVFIRSEDIKKMADNDVAIVDGIKIPLVDLRKQFGGVSQCRDDTAESVDNTLVKSGIVAVVVKKGDELVGLVVDKLVSEQEVTVKPLSSILRNVKGFSGSTILGDGRTILILDIANLSFDDFDFSVGE